MIKTFMLVMSMVKSHQCMKPATSMQVNKTHIITNMEPRQLPSVINVVKNMQTKFDTTLKQVLSLINPTYCNAHISS